MSRGGKYIEIDVNITKDGFPVLIHDWNESYVRRFCNPLYTRERELIIPTLRQFKEFKTNNNLRQLTLDEIVELMQKNKELMIILDAKETLDSLIYIKKKYPKYIDRFIPQIYNRLEFFDVQKMGYNKIIYTLYADQSKPSISDILKFSVSTNITAVTFPKEHFNKKYKTLPGQLSKNKIKSFIHTVNNKKDFDVFKDEKGFGIYTDYIYLK